MILVTLGTQDKSFKRLLDAVENNITNGNIKDEVIVQAGITKYTSKNMKIFDLLPYDKFDEYIKKCDILITHAGVGSIMAGLKNGKVVIAAPRLKEYNEHTNNHQLEIVEAMSKEGYILPLLNMDELGNVLKKVKTFKPKKYKSQTDNMIKILENYIDKETID